MKTSLPTVHFLIAVGIFGVAIATTHARNPIRSTFFTTYPAAVGTQLDNLPNKPGHCGVCHYDFNGGGTRNPYGQAIESAGYSLNQEVGRSNAIWSAP